MIFIIVVTFTMFCQNVIYLRKNLLFNKLYLF